MKRILFVDDEERVLEGLRRLFYPLREEWQTTFVSSGSRALEIMSDETFDVIVTDIRMPGMDGTQLLSRVRELHPDVVRIVLSGQSDHELTLKSAGAAHQYLSKPCDADTMRLTIARAISLKDTFSDPSLQALVSGARSLPSIPSLYVELLKQMERTESSAQDVADVIAKDTAMTAKVLQLANSAFFGIQRRISDPKDAALYLGFDTLKALALTVKVFSQFKASPASRFSIDGLANHCLSTGILARKIAKAAGASKQVVEDSFMAGILHDVGKLILVDARPEKYGEAIVLSESKGISVWVAERSIFGTTHAEVGTYLLWLWGFPDPVVEAVAYHHAPSLALAASFSPLTAVHVANVLSHMSSAQRGGAAPELDTQYVETLGLAEQISCWQSLFAEIPQEQPT